MDSLLEEYDDSFVRTDAPLSFLCLITSLILLAQGHSVTNKKNSDGRTDSLQTLHNLNEGLFLINLFSDKPY